MVPGLILGTSVKRKVLPSPQTESPPVTQTEAPQKTSVSIELELPDGSVQTMDLEDYLVGVVLGEMPASFETEALKAQAVVARTYTLKCAEAGVKHGVGRMCGDYACCQAYVDRESYTGTQEDYEKIQNAVEATWGQVITYQGKLIEATYFSCSGGITEDAVAVWGTDYPYLRSVDSPGEEHATYYTDEVFFSSGEFQDKLGQKLSGSPANWLGFTTYTAGGGVNTIRIGDKDYKGTDLRMLLGLRSTAFSMKAEEDGIRVITKGFGHRVGMSQYGADAMALQGKNYEEILTHYYQGTELSDYEN